MKRLVRLSLFVLTLLIQLESDASENGAGNSLLSAALQIPESLEAETSFAKALNASLARCRSANCERSDLLDLGLLYHANGYERRAKEVYQYLLDTCESRGERARLHYLFANLVLEKGDSAQALEHFKASVQAVDDYPLSLVYLGDSMFKQGSYGEALACYKRALELDANTELARIGIARVYERRGEIERAVGELETLLEVQSRESVAMAMLSQLYSRLGEYERAYEISQGIEISSTAPVDDPWLRPVRDAIFDAQRLDFLYLDYYVVGRREEAKEILDRIEGIDPGKSRWSKYRGVAYMESGYFEEATLRFKQGLREGGSPAEFYPLLVKSIRLQAKPYSALKIAEEATREHGDISDVCVEWCHLLVDLGRREKAIAVLERGIRFNPYHIESHLLLGRLALQEGKRALAVRSLDEARRLAPMTEKTLLRIALIYMESGLFASAQPVLEHTYEMYPYSKEAGSLLSDSHFELGMKLVRENERSKALDHFGKVSSLSENHQNALSITAQVLLQQQQFEEAEKCLRNLFSYYTPRAGMLLIYGDVLARNGKNEEAKESWKQALELAERHRSPEELRNMLRVRLGQGKAW